MKKILSTIAKAINYLQRQVYGWMPKDKSLHFFAGAMILAFTYPTIAFSTSISMLIVFVVAVLKEVFDANKHRLGMKQGEFDKEDIVYTLAGASCIATIIGVIDLFKWL